MDKQGGFDMIKRLLISAAMVMLLASSAWATGTVTGAKGNIFSGFNGQTCILNVVADGSAGTVPDTVISTTGCGNMTGFLTEVYVTVGSPAPTAGYKVYVYKSSTVDILGGVGVGLSATGNEDYIPKDSGGTSVATKSIDTTDATLHIVGPSGASIGNGAIVKIYLVIGAEYNK
jgi:hypothetical protein